MNARTHTLHLHARRAFTLIELLTVIAIIGILAAILIPTIGAVRQTAKQASCASNLRQIATAVIAYTNDNRGLLPGGKDSSGKYSGTFRGIVPPGLAGIKSVDVITNKEEGNGQLSGLLAHYLSTGKNSNIWLCPGNTAAYDATTNGTTYICNNQSDTSPAYFFGQTGTTAGSVAATPKKIGSQLMSGTVSRISEPSQLWLISDIDSTNYGGQSGMPSVGDANEIKAAHKTSRNYAFFDGHVEARKADNFPANP